MADVSKKPENNEMTNDDHTESDNIDKVPLIHDPDYLEKQNPVEEFDPYVVFIEKPEEKIHDYYIDGQKWDGSTTKFIHSFFSDFDADAIIQKMRLGKSWGPKHKYWGMTDEQIKQKWEDSNKDAGPLGTAMHAKIEKFYNIPELFPLQEPSREKLLKYYTVEELDVPEIQQFLKYHKEWPSFRKWKPFRTELRVFDRALQIPGSVDMLYLSPRSTPENPLLIMVDWKRSKEIKMKSFYSREQGKYITGNGPCQDLPDCNYYHYSLQVNWYTALIERNTRYRVEEMYVAVFHPSAPDYQVYPVSRHFNVIFSMIQIRLDQQAAKALDQQATKEQELETKTDQTEQEKSEPDVQITCEPDVVMETQRLPVEVSANIVTLDVDIIVQQCNCLAVKSHGLSKEIADSLDVDVYKLRKSTSSRKNLAKPADRGFPGTIEVVTVSDSIPNPRPKYVACLFSQFSPGKPNQYYQDIVSAHGFTDNAEQRLTWFRECLVNFKNFCDPSEIKSIAFPKYIGCGLAGGDYNLYQKALNEFIEGLPNEISIYIVNFNQ